MELLLRILRVWVFWRVLQWALEGLGWLDDSLVLLSYWTLCLRR
jgi:hypothetical protein